MIGAYASVKEIRYKDQEEKKAIVMQGDMSDQVKDFFLLDLAEFKIDENFIRYEDGGIMQEELLDLDNDIAFRKALSAH